MSKEIHEISITDLASYLCDSDIGDEDLDMDNELQEKFGCSLESFDKLVRALVPLIDVGKSPLTDTTYKGFGADGMWLVKQEVGT